MTQDKPLFNFDFSENQKLPNQLLKAQSDLLYKQSGNTVKLEIFQVQISEYDFDIPTEIRESDLVFNVNVISQSLKNYTFPLLVLGQSISGYPVWIKSEYFKADSLYLSDDEYQFEENITEIFSNEKVQKAIVSLSKY